MALFRRKKKKQEEQTSPSEASGVQSQDPQQAEAASDTAEPKHGPYDISERDASEGYIDLGPLKVPAIAGLQLQPQFAPDKKSIARLNIVVGNSVLQVLVAAGPKSGGGWKQILEGTEESFKKQGAEVEHNPNGPLGEELIAKVPVKTADGRPAVAPSRIIGMDGDRWILRVDIVGGALVDKKAFQAVATIINNLIVERDSAPRPPLSIIPMTIPKDLVQQQDQAQQAAQQGSQQDQA